MSIYEYINNGREASRRRNTAPYSIFVPIGYPPTSGGTPPTITSSAPPSGTQSTAYTHTFTATGTAPITWSVSSGSLPAGLSLNASTGVLSGTPSGSGTTGFTVRATNGSGTADQVVSLVIAAAYGAPVVTGVTFHTWWEAGLIVGLNDGDPVSSWTDSITGVIASQTLTNRPTYRPTGFNGLPCLEFDGVNDFMNLNAAVIPANGDGTMVVVIEPLETRAGKTLFAGSNPYEGSVITHISTPGIIQMYDAGGYISLGPAIDTSRTVAVISVSGTASHYRNGSLWGSATKTSTPKTHWGTAVFGFGRSFGASFDRAPNIRLAAIGFIGRAVTAGEAASISSILQSRYGIT